MPKSREVSRLCLPLHVGYLKGRSWAPLLYVLYTAPLADIIKSHKLQYHFYVDDTQLYVTLKTNCGVDAGLCRSE